VGDAVRKDDLLREQSKLLFGNSDRLEVALAVAQSDLDAVNATDLAEVLAGWPNNRIRAQLVALARVGLLQSMPRDDDSGKIWYRRMPAHFWGACIELVELWGAGDGRPEPRPAESGLLESQAGEEPADHVPSQALEDIWARVTAHLALVIDEATYRIWIEPLRAIEFSSGRLVVEIPPHALGWIRERFGNTIQASVECMFGSDVCVEFTAASGVSSSSRAVDKPLRRSQAGATRPRVDADPSLVRQPSATLGPVGNSKLTFDQFVVGDSNRLAYAAALTVSEMPARVYNPLFICGPPGVGKTHLLSSIANILLSRNPGLVIRWTTGEAFTNDFLGALSAGSTEAFKLRFRDINVLLLDDIQFLERKTKTEEEFFYTFKALHDAGCQIVLSSDRPPHDLQALEERLRERFEAGLVADIKPPEFDTRLAILRKRVQHDCITFADDDALQVIAEHVHANVRALEGALIRVVAFSSLTGRPLTSELAHEVLDSLYPRARAAERKPTISEIQAVVGQHFGLTRDELLSAARTAHVAWPRQIAMYLARELSGESLPAIGREFGGRDHTTVLHAWRRTSTRITSDQASLEAVEGLRRTLDQPSPSDSSTIALSR
jgi:chromosomal replication initiator protein